MIPPHVSCWCNGRALDASALFRENTPTQGLGPMMQASASDGNSNEPTPSGFLRLLVAWGEVLTRVFLAKKLFDLHRAKSPSVRALHWNEPVRKVGNRARGMSASTMNRHMRALKEL